MSVVAEAPAEITSAAQIPEKTLLSGLALTSFAALLLELALTRLFSVVLFYHFAFLAISIALLGLGSGGVFAYLGKNWLGRFSTRLLLSCLCGSARIGDRAARPGFAEFVGSQFVPSYGDLSGLCRAIFRDRSRVLRSL